VLNQLLKHTAVQSRFSANMVALVGSQPRTLSLKDFLQHFLEFRWGGPAGWQSEINEGA
jgi:DNA gyrase subunit A